MARTILFGLALTFTVLPVLGAAGILFLHGPHALLALPPQDWATLIAGLFVPSALAFLALGYAAQRMELSLLHHGLAQNSAALAKQEQRLAALAEETRAQNEILREHVRLTLEQLRGVKRRAEATERLFAETRLQRLTAEWDIVSRELGSILASMFRLAFGTERLVGNPGDDAPVFAAVPLPPMEELPVAILRLLPRTQEELARLEVDERFLRLAARYRAVFAAFVDRVPDTGPLNRAFFRSLLHGRVHERLGLLPRPEAEEAPIELMAAE